MKMFRISLIILLFFPNLLYSQSIVVKDKFSNLPIKGVKCTNLQTGKMSVTNSKGLTHLDFDSGDTIYFVHINYMPIRIKARNIESTVYLFSKNNELEEISVNVNSIRENAKEQMTAVSLLDNKMIRFSTNSNSADILAESGHVMVQKTQGGGGSPILRGFEANKVLLVVDGIRLNNAIYRSGHLQNSLTIDHAVLDKIELIYGAGSVLYGSDALGGVIHYHTLNPEFSLDTIVDYNTTISSSAASATQSVNFHVHQTAGTKKWASLLSFTANSYGDIHMGNNRLDYKSIDDTNLNWGLLPYYAAINEQGHDTMLVNPDPSVQKRMAYKQYDVLYKFRLKLNTKNELFTNMQASSSSNIQRFDKLNDFSGDFLKYADYYYGPQTRLMASAGLVMRSSKMYDFAKIIVAYQKIQESRISRKFKNVEALHQIEDLHIFSINGDYQKQLKNSGRFYYGYEFLANNVNSSAFYQDIFSGTKMNAQTRYPEGGSHTFSSALYSDFIYPLSSRWKLNTGLRVSTNFLSSVFKDKSFTQLPFDTIRLQNLMPSGSISLQYNIGNMHLTFIQSSGFRSPNVDDYGKIRAKNGLITLPNNLLKPEYTWHSELIVEQNTDNMSLSFSAYHDLLFDAIVRTSSQLNGMDSLFYDGEMYKIIVNTNAERAQIFGVSAEFNAKIHTQWIRSDYWEWRNTANFTRGINLSQNEPLGHIPPFFMRSSLGYFLESTETRFSFLYSDAKPLSLLSPYGEDNEDEATIVGFPAWWILNVQFNTSLANKWQFSFAVENVFDKHYKSFASAISAPGRNFILSASVHF